MNIDTTYLERCILILDKALTLLKKSEVDSIDYDLYRSACIKEFEIILEQSGSLLRKALKPYFHSSKAVDQLTFKDVFRNGLLRDIVSTDACERWLNYRNNTAHDYGVNFAEETVLILPQFIADASTLSENIKQLNIE